MRVNIGQAAAALLKKAEAVQQQTKRAEDDTAREALILARAYSSGPFSTAQLRAMGHPFARRAPRPPGNPAVINRQTGLFRALWRLRKFESSGRGLRAVIVNDVPYAKYLGERGTARMIGRPIVRAVAQKMRRLRERRLTAAVQRALDL